MKFVNDATAKDTAFIKCFPDDSGVYARVLTARKDRTKPEEQCHAGSPYTRANTCP